jgi:hypothetical protein
MRLGRAALAVAVFMVVVPGFGVSQLAPRARVPRTLTAMALRDLRFGTLLPGIPMSVLYDDVHRAGLFEVWGERSASVRIELTLPPSMTTSSGYELPLFFGPGDGAFAPDRGRPHGIPFDPRAPLVAILGASGKLYIRLGGTALPDRMQATGEYSGTISLTVYDVGI